MNQNYEQVPNIITGKDLDYLSDIFEWNYGAYKESANAVNSVEDQEIKSMLSKASNIFHGNMSTVLNILKQGGASNE